MDADRVHIAGRMALVTHTEPDLIRADIMANMSIPGSGTGVLRAIGEGRGVTAAIRLIMAGCRTAAGSKSRG